MNHVHSPQTCSLQLIIRNAIEQYLCYNTHYGSVCYDSCIHQPCIFEYIPSVLRQQSCVAQQKYDHMNRVPWYIDVVHDKPLKNIIRNVMTSWQGHAFHITGPSWGKSIVNGGFHPQTISDTDFWFFVFGVSNWYHCNETSMHNT